MRPLDIFAHIHPKPRNMRMYPDIVDNIPKTLHIFLKYLGDKQTPVRSTEDFAGQKGALGYPGR
jgi:hypothetical protein